jgi:mannose-6-phosphate isomerase-like protein (cupin superfamily)
MKGKFGYPCEIKRWGHALHVASDAMFTSVLRVDEGGYSSQHRHTSHANTLIAVLGEVVIQTLGRGEAPDRGESRNYVLQPSEAITVPAGTWHKFVCYGSAVVLEYYSSADPQAKYDIERYDQGGCR